ncbi:MAG: LacI family transcriptional regulator [Clostridia bacterium]|nr:LacI family transcriptional regulator [Clostridia bacterium]NLS84452.1 LacI family transcriptional regulator [Oscillospiraceae bacterium]
MATIKTVAKLAGVSASTVSRTISGKGYVNDTTKEKIQEAIRQTGYSPNVLAKSLKMGSSNTIALLVPDIQNLIFPAITRGIEDTARKNGFAVLLCNTDEDSDVEKGYIDKLKNRWIDGFVVCSYTPGSNHIRALHSAGFPTVLVNRYEPGSPIDTITIDNYQSAYNAVGYLIRGGSKHIAIALGREELILYRERYRGYCDALKDTGLPYDEALVMRETSGSDSFYGLTKELFAKNKNVDGIFATSDPKAFVVLHALHDLGIKIPSDVAVIGFDNVDLSAKVEPPLSTVSQPLYEMGVIAATKLIRQIKYKVKNGVLPAPVCEVLNTDLIVRRSTR